MKAIVFREGIAVLEDRDRPAPGPDQALVRTRVAGICGTDLELLGGYHDFSGVAGHEFVGVVEQAPPGSGLAGRRVVAEINIGCGSCPACLAGDPRQCPGRRAIGIRDWDGAFAEYLVAPLENLAVVDDSIGDEEAVFAEPLAAALRIAEQVHLKPNLRAAVLGDGKLGLLTALALRVYLPGLVLIGRRAARLSLAAGQGLETVLLGREEKESELAARTGPFDLVIEATGRPSGIGYALALVRPRGVLVVKTTVKARSEIDLADLVVREIKVLGSRCGRFGLALDFLKNKRLDPRPLIEAVYGLEDFERAFALARRPGTGKVLLRPA